VEGCGLGIRVSGHEGFALLFGASEPTPAPAGDLRATTSGRTADIRNELTPFAGELVLVGMLSGRPTHRRISFPAGGIEGWLAETLSDKLPRIP
jgi:hypothetical protein